MPIVRKQLQALQEEQDALSTQLGSASQPGPLTLAARAAQADAEMTAHTLTSANYQDMANARRAIVEAEGKNPDTDPSLATILKTQQQFHVKANAPHAQLDATLQQAASAGHDLSQYGYTPTADGIAPAAAQPSSTAPASTDSPAGSHTSEAVQP